MPSRSCRVTQTSRIVSDTLTKFRGRSRSINTKPPKERRLSDTTPISHAPTNQRNASGEEGENGDARTAETPPPEIPDTTGIAGAGCGRGADASAKNGG